MIISNHFRCYHLPDEFFKIIAEMYFSTTSAILKEYAPNHLNLGCRVVGVSAPDVVLKEMGKYVDVVSINFYAMALPKAYLATLYEMTHKPILITEFSFSCGTNYGFYNSTNGAQNVIVKNQEARGIEYANLVNQAYNLPYVVGSHWFALYDFVGDIHDLRGNYGLFDLEDKPWEELIGYVRVTNKTL